MNLVAFTSDKVSVFHVIDEMKQRGWYVQPQLAFGDSKENIHLSINPASVRWVDAFLDRSARVRRASAKTLPSGELAARDPRGVRRRSTPGRSTATRSQGCSRMAGVDGAPLPARMAEINEVLNALPVALRERLLVEYLNDLFRCRE